MGSKPRAYRAHFHNSPGLTKADGRADIERNYIYETRVAPVVVCLGRNHLRSHGFHKQSGRKPRHDLQRVSLDLDTLDFVEIHDDATLGPLLAPGRCCRIPPARVVEVQLWTIRFRIVVVVARCTGEAPAITKADD